MYVSEVYTTGIRIFHRIVYLFSSLVTSVDYRIR